jgi:hypothetical protein
MARACTVVLSCVALAAPSWLAACESARDGNAMRRVETPIVAARHEQPPAPAQPAPQLAAAAPAQVAAEAAAPDGEASKLDAQRPLIRPLSAQRDAWEKRLRKIPELARYAGRFVPFDGKAADAALGRGQRSRSSVSPYWTIADGPIAWSPAPRSELFVATGSIGDRALIAVLEVQASGALRHAASLVIDDKDTSIALGSSAEHPGELLWTTCYGCAGEGGSIVVGDDGRPRFVYR